MSTFLNARRLRDYPLLIGIALWAVFGSEVLLRRGWQGALGQILGTDFITLYGAGLLYRQGAERLYDFGAQARIQAALIAPTPYPGLNPFISPPYVAMVYGALTVLPLPLAFALWNGLTLGWALHAAWMLHHLLPKAVRAAGLSFARIMLLLFSFFPFLAGWRVGQNHGLTLWLITGILLLRRAGRPGWAGLLAGGLLYKPQFTLGFLVLWLAWRELRTLLAFGATAALWIGLSLWTGGLVPYREYLARSELLLSLPWLKGFPAALMITPYGLLATMLPASAQPVLRIGSMAALLLLGLGLFLIALPLQRQPFERQAPAWMLAMLYPLLAFPYALIHDLITLVPVLALWAISHPSPRLLYVAIAVYLGALILPFAGALTRLALPALLPMGIFIAMAWEGLLPPPRCPFREALP